ncbi:MAG: hypothetical protein GTO12_15855 [Proteobacteria bacterium]|nr:hypothetical protein [Pseudomonadota bacterium]
MKYLRLRSGLGHYSFWILTVGGVIVGWNQHGTLGKIVSIICPPYAWYLFGKFLFLGVLEILK